MPTNIHQTSALNKTFFGGILIAVLAVPLVYLYCYEKQALSVVDSQQIEKRVDELLSRSRQIGLHLQRQTERKLNWMLQQSQQRNYVEDELIKQKIHARVEANNCPLPIKNHQHLTVLSVLVLETSSQSLENCRKMFMKGLGWFNDKYQMNMSIIEWSSDAKVEDIDDKTLVVVFDEFRYEFVEDNIANRLRKAEYRDEYYVGQAVKQLRSTPFFSHCKFTNIQCSQTTFLLLSPHVKQKSYLNVEQQLFIFDQFDLGSLFNSLSEYLQVDVLEKLGSRGDIQVGHLGQLYHLLKKQSYIKQNIQSLEYLSFLFKPVETNVWDKLVRLYSKSFQKAQQYVLEGKPISPYIHDPSQMSLIAQLMDNMEAQVGGGKKGEKLEVDPMTDPRVGKIDLFPNNFKFGVYLPLLFLFVYPVLIKIRDLLSSFFKREKVKVE